MKTKYADRSHPLGRPKQLSMNDMGMGRLSAMVAIWQSYFPQRLMFARYPFFVDTLNRFQVLFRHRTMLRAKVLGESRTHGRLRIVGENFAASRATFLPVAVNQVEGKGIGISSVEFVSATTRFT